MGFFFAKNNLHYLLIKIGIKVFLVFLIFKSSFTVFCDCVSSSNMIKKDVFGEKKFTNRLNSLGNMVYINRKLKWSQNHLLRNLRNEVSLKTCFLEFLNFQNSFFHKLKWLFPVEINNFNNNLFWSHCAEFDQVNNYGFFPNCQKLVNPSHILISHIITWNGTLKSKKTSVNFKQQNELIFTGI